MRKTLAIALLVPALALFACGRLNDDGGTGAGGTGSTGSSGSSGPSGSGGIAHPTGADELILRMQIGGGFVPVEWNLKAVPGFSLYGDGRLIVEGPVIEIYPGPALPNLQVMQLTEDAVQAILQAAQDAGLMGEDTSYDYPCIADAPTTTFTVVDDAGTHTVSAYALAFEEGSGQSACAGVDAEARQLLADFSVKLGDLESWLPEGSIGPSQDYVPTEMRVYVRPYMGDVELEQQPVEWPLSVPLDSFGDKDPNLADTRCGVVSGEDLDALLPLAQSANELTPWVDDGSTHGLIFRPLLPDEHTC
jgi:hypothetical protein